METHLEDFLVPDVLLLQQQKVFDALQLQEAQSTLRRRENCSEKTRGRGV